MKITATDIPDVLIIEPRVFGDARGFFFESFNQKVWEDKAGLRATFVQNNHSRSERHVPRGVRQRTGVCWAAPSRRTP
jgi:dTDP-4-dehydrorhamnose 3,5-epimerase